MSEQEKKKLWCDAACAAISAGRFEMGVIAILADSVVQAFDERYGDAAYLLAGQKQCAACHEPIDHVAERVVSQDMTAFCSRACLLGSGRVE